MSCVDEDAPTRILGPHSRVTFFDGRFRIERLLAVGGMGSVYCARDLHTDDQVALKVLRKDYRTDLEATQRFQREIEILSTVASQYVVGLITSGRPHSGLPWFAMELLRGRTLSEYIRTHRRVSPEEMVAIVDGICEALEAAHAVGIIHRDLKPSNIFLPHHAHTPVKLLDFGISTMPHYNELTQAGTVVGTPRYIAPERLLGTPIDLRADIYSLGVIVFEALTGYSPFATSDQTELLVSIAEGKNRRYLADLRPEFAGELSFVLEKAIRSEPEGRYVRARCFAEAFRTAVARSRRRDSGIRMHVETNQAETRDDTATESLEPLGGIYQARGEPETDPGLIRQIGKLFGR